MQYQYVIDSLISLLHFFFFIETLYVDEVLFY